MQLICCVDGNIGACKSTVLNALAQRGYKVFQEDLSDWGEMLSRFYADQKRWMCTLQVSILHSMHQQHQTIRQSPESIVFVERSPQSSMVFVKNGERQGFMDPEEVRVVEKLYGVLKWTPDINFYIDTPIDVCYDRIQKRNRDCEHTIELEYLAFLDEEYRKTYSAPEMRGKHVKLDGTLPTHVLADKIVETLEKAR